MWSLRKWLARRKLDASLADWRIVNAVNDATGQAAVFRLRIRKPRIRKLGKFRIAVTVTWRYGQKGEMPSKPVHEKQTQFDRALDGLSSENGYAELMRVATGDGLKEWLYYTSDIERFGQTFNEMLAGLETFPVDVNFEEDPSWSIWQEFVQVVESRTVL